MHDLDLMLKLHLEGKYSDARIISDRLEKLGPYGITDDKGQNTSMMWTKHCYNRGWFKLQEGDYKGGCQLLENGRFLNVYGSPPLKTTAPIYNPEEHDIKNKTIIVSLEGGAGDEIISSRFATTFKRLGAAKVYLAAAPEFSSIFSRIDGVDKVIYRSQAHTVAHDFWVPGFSAGWVAGHTFDTLGSDPYLEGDPAFVASWRQVLNKDNKPRVGIRWAGNPKFEHEQHRRFPINFITDLSRYSKKINLYSFQRDDNLVALPEEITDLQHKLTSWEHTAAALINMDLVITSCTSVAHMAAALGKETWVIVPCLPYHTWTWKAPHSTTTPYYKSVRIFRQKQQGSWVEPFEQIYKALEDKYGL